MRRGIQETNLKSQEEYNFGPMSLITPETIQMEICSNWMETRFINLGDRQAFLDQFRFRHSPDWLLFNI